MTTTIPTQADDLRIIAEPPTVKDAELILQQMAIDATTGAHRGFERLNGFENPPTLTQLRRKYAPGTTEYGEVMALLMSCETTGTFVKNGLLSEALVKDVLWVAGVWRRTEKICKGLRKEAGEPRLFENFERLATS